VTDHASWPTRYVLLLWLSILALVPFDLATIDSYGGSADGASGAGSGRPGLIASLVSTCKAYLADPGPVSRTDGFHRACREQTDWPLPSPLVPPPPQRPHPPAPPPPPPAQVRTAAALCLSRLLSRTDMERRGGELTSFMDWAAATLATCTSALPPASSLGVRGVDEDAEAPPRPASVVAAAALAARGGGVGAQSASVGGADAASAAALGDTDGVGGPSGGSTAATRTFLAAGVMQVRLRGEDGVGKPACPLWKLLESCLLASKPLSAPLLTSCRPSSRSLSTVTGTPSSASALQTSSHASSP
jgi:hypothetical protein